MEKLVNEAFISNHHSLLKSSQLEEFRQTQQLCDVTLKTVDGTSFGVHKIALCAGCSYFDKLFNGDWKESREDVIQLDHPISGKCFEILLKFIYSSRIEIKEISLKDAFMLHEGSVFFNLDSLKKFCAKMLENFITNESLLEIFQHSVSVLNDMLTEKCIECISKNFDEFFEKHVNDLTATELREITSNRNIVNRENIFLILIKWLKFDLTNRRKYVHSVMEKLNFINFSNEFLRTQVLSEEILLENKDFSLIMTKVFRKTLEPKKTKLPFNLGAVTKTEKIYAVTNKGLRLLNFDHPTKQLFKIVDYELGSKFSTCAIGNSGIFISGGLESNECWYYCPNLNQFKPYKKMLEKRNNHGMLFYKNKIFSCGGEDMKSIEYCDLNTEIWSAGPEMKEVRSDFGIFEEGGRIYLVGGLSKPYFNSSIESFDPRENIITVNKINVVGLGNTRIIKNCEKNRFIKTFDDPNCGDLYDYSVLSNDFTISSFNLAISLDLSKCNFDMIQYKSKYYLLGSLPNRDREKLKNILMTHDMGSENSKWVYDAIEFKCLESNEFHLETLIA